MSAWTPTELDHIAKASELRVASRRPDGTLRSYVTIWVARSGEDIYIRSAHGPENGWFRRAQAAGTGRISAGGVEADVIFETVDAQDRGVHEAIDAALHAKYDRYGPGPVGAITGPATWPVTLRVGPDRAGD